MFLSFLFSDWLNNRNRQHPEQLPSDKRLVNHHFFIYKTDIPEIVKAIEDEFNFKVCSSKYNGLKDSKLQTITELEYIYDSEGNVVKIKPLFCMTSNSDWKRSWTNVFRTFRAIAPIMCKTNNGSVLQFQNRTGTFEKWGWCNEQFIKII